MKIKIIKRSVHEETVARARAAEGLPREDITLRATVVVVNSWVEELRQKRASDAEVSRRLFEEKFNKLFA